MGTEHSPDASEGGWFAAVPTLSIPSTTTTARAVRVFPDRALQRQRRNVGARGAHYRGHLGACGEHFANSRQLGGGGKAALNAQYAALFLSLYLSLPTPFPY